MAISHVVQVVGENGNMSKTRLSNHHNHRILARGRMPRTGTRAPGWEVTMDDPNHQEMPAIQVHGDTTSDNYQQQQWHPHPQKDNKGKKGGKDKGKAPVGKGPSGKTLQPSWRSKGAEATSTAPPKTLSAAEIRLQEFTKELQSGEMTLTTRVQSMIAENAQITAQDELQQMQSSASNLSQAKKQMGLALQARQNLHASWKKLLAESVQQWKEWSQEFNDQDNALKDQVEQARDNVKQARQTWEESKDDTMEISDAEDTEEKEGKGGAASVVADGITEMLTKSKADSLGPDQPPAKKARSNNGKPFGGGG